MPLCGSVPSIRPRPPRPGCCSAAVLAVRASSRRPRAAPRCFDGGLAQGLVIRGVRHPGGRSTAGHVDRPQWTGPSGPAKEKPLRTGVGSGFLNWCPEEAPTDHGFMLIDASAWVFYGYLLSSPRRCRTKGSVDLLYGNVAGGVALEHALTAQLCDGVPIQTHHLRSLGNRHLRGARVACRVQAHGTFCGGGCRLLDQPLDVQIHDQKPLHELHRAGGT